MKQVDKLLKLQETCRQKEENI